LRSILFIKGSQLLYRHFKASIKETTFLFVLLFMLSSDKAEPLPD